MLLVVANLRYEDELCEAVPVTHLTQSFSRGQQREPLQPEVHAAGWDVPQIEPLFTKNRPLFKHTFFSSG